MCNFCAVRAVMRVGNVVVKSSGVFFFFQAEDGIRDAQESRGLGDVYKRQVTMCCCWIHLFAPTL